MPDEESNPVLSRGIDIEAELDRYRRRLLDLSTRNRLLSYKKSRTRTIQIIDELPDQIFSHLIDDQRGFGFQHLEDDPQSLTPVTPDIELPQNPVNPRRVPARHQDDFLQTDLSEDRLDKALTALGRDAHSAIQETGVNHLHLALGFLEWTESKDSDKMHSAPLILIPVRLVKSFSSQRKKYIFEIRHTGEELQSNVSLSEKLQHDFGIKLPEYDEQSSPDEYFIQVKDTLPDDVDWPIRREAVIGFFSFSKIHLYKDLDPKRWPSGQLIGNSIIRSVFEGAQRDEASFRFRDDYAIDEVDKDFDIPLVVDADSSQHSALIDVSKEENLVIEGPPGTGKSQTITNILATALHKGWNVLFLAEKLAALEVVKSNLEKIGLDSFCLPLHSELGKPAEVYKSLGERLTRDFHQDRTAEREYQRLQDRRDKLLAYRNALCETHGPYDDPAYTIFWRVASLRLKGAKRVSDAPIDCGLDTNGYENRLLILKRLGEFAVELGSISDHTWSGFHCPKYFASNETEVADALTSLKSAAARFQDAAYRFRQESSCDSFWSLGALCELDPSKIELLDTSTHVISDPICKGLLRPEARATAEQLIRNLSEYRELAASINENWRVEPELCFELSERFRASLSTFPQQSWAMEIRAVLSCRARAQATAGKLASLEPLWSRLRELGLPSSTLRDCRRSLKILRLLTDDVVLDDSVLGDHLFLGSTREIAVAAKHSHGDLAERQSQLDIRLVINDAPDTQAISELRRGLRKYARSRFRFLSSEYRGLKRDTLAFVRPSVKWDIAAVSAELEHLAEFRGQVAQFESDPRYTKQLGELFRGMETDWSYVERVLAWTNSISSFGFVYAQVQEFREQLAADGTTSWIDEAEQVLSVVGQELASAELQLLLGATAESILDTPVLEILTRSDRVSNAIGDLADVLSKAVVHDNTTLQDARDRCDSIERLKSMNLQISSNTDYQDLCGRSFEGASTDPALVQSTLEWFDNLSKLGMPRDLLRWVCSDDVESRTGMLSEALFGIRSDIAASAASLKILENLGSVDVHWLFDLSTYSTPTSRFLELERGIPKLATWAEFCRCIDRLKALGLDDFYMALRSGQMGPSEIASAYELGFWEEIALTAVHSEPALSDFSRRDHEQIRADFGEIDRRLMEINRSIVAANASRRRPPMGIGTGRVGEYTELSLIQHEIGKSRRHCRIRNLILRAGRALQCIKPCFMMSPLAVAQHLPPGAVQFDLVVMDEASQIKPEDALGALARASRLVVVGDPKQLPPTSFFDRLDKDEIDEDEETTLDDSESILEVAEKVFPGRRRLKWHYRSQHQSLIQFSNERFYDGDLYVFPTPSPQGGRLGVRFHKVEDGHFKSGKNETEAFAVADAIAEHVVSCANESLGVGTFNMKQRDLIADRLDQLCAEDSSLRTAFRKFNDQHDEVFIKNLENLQGDERDVIFISYTYGIDPDSGQVFQRFGPITLENGWRRLNVLVTRARRRVEVFSSLSPGQIQAEGKSKGVVSMKDYLDYAQTGRVPERIIQTGLPMESPFEEAVAKAVESMGVEVVPQVGVAGYRIDLGILRPGSNEDFILGIECDGATYHSAKSVRDRDRLRESVITSRGWKIHRVWSTDWFQNQRSEVERLQAVLAEQLERT